MKAKIWGVKDIPDQAGRVAIITGASSGIGFETARALAGKNATVVMAVRDKRKGERALKDILNENPNAHLEIMHLDLADLMSIKDFADNYLKKFERLDLLINNAGVMIPPYSKTKDGFELQFGTNHLGHFALTGLLLGLILKTNDSRIVNVSSGAHRYGNINFDDLNWKKRKYLKWRSYGDSKIANLYFTYELRDKLKKIGTRTIVTSAHPGISISELQRHSKFVKILTRIFGMKSEQGALPILRAAVDSDAENGDYFGPDGWRELKGYPKKVRSNRRSQDKEIAKKLWKLSETLTDVKYQF